MSFILKIRNVLRKLNTKESLLKRSWDVAKRTLPVARRPEPDLALLQTLDKPLKLQEP